MSAASNQASTRTAEPVDARRADGNVHDRHALSPHDAQAAFHEHVVRKAAAARERYGPCIGPDQILAMLHDQDVVRYHTSLAFDAALLEPHEFAWPKALGFHPHDGFCLFLHPHFEHQRDAWPLLIAYHIPAINYGNIVEAIHAELFASTLLGLPADAYYQRLCALADSIPRPGSAACR
jgi:hypothetical protein